MKILGINFCWHDWVKLKSESDCGGCHLVYDKVCLKCKAVELNATEAKERKEKEEYDWYIKRKKAEAILNEGKDE
jgi:hypothetical protein